MARITLDRLWRLVRGAGSRARTPPASGAVRGIAPPPVPPRSADQRRAAAVAAARRRARWLRAAGYALAGAGLVGAVGIIVLRTATGTSRAGRPPAAVTGDVSPAPAPLPPPAGGIAPTPPAPRPADVAPARSPAVPPAAAEPRLPWAPPTAPTPLELAYLPAGSQLVVAARPAALLADEEGRRFVRALGPRVEAALAAVAATCGCRPADIESLQAGCQAAGTDAAVVGWTARLGAATTLPTDEAWRARTWGPGTPAARAGETIHAGPGASAWAPSSGAGRVLVVAPAAALAEIVAAAAEADPPPLVVPSDLERLVGVLHGSRHLTVVGSPQYLRHGGRAILAGEFAPLAAGVEALLGDDVQAAALSVHCGAEFFVELDAIATLDLKPAAHAARLAERIAGLPGAVEALCTSGSLHPYGRDLVASLPAMLRALAAHVRTGAEGRVAVATVRLPRPAAHNLALAAELLLAQRGGTAAAPADAGPPGADGALARLDRPLTLRFAKDTLEKAIQMIAEEVGVPIDIAGPDLQREGVTKNQSFAIDERDRPAADVLRVILAKADPKGTLVYVVRTQGGHESIEITTRAAVARRGDRLPPAFQEAGGVPDRDPK